MFTSPRPWPVVTAAAELRLATIGPPQPAVPPDPDTWIGTLGSLPLLAQPGERWLYNTGAAVLGVLLARAAGQSLPDGQWSRPPAFPDGAAGLISTADDLLTFARSALPTAPSAGLARAARAPPRGAARPGRRTAAAGRSRRGRGRAHSGPSLGRHADDQPRRLRHRIGTARRVLRSRSHRPHRGDPPGRRHALCGRRRCHRDPTTAAVAANWLVDQRWPRSMSVFSTPLGPGPPRARADADNWLV
jgi:hypothetical protein